jgi:hypothetical protein
MLTIIAQNSIEFEFSVGVTLAEMKASGVKIPTQTSAEASSVAGIEEATLLVQNLDLSTTTELDTIIIASESSINIEDMLIKVPLGQLNVINRAVLKSLGAATEMALFPNLPLEIRQKIYDCAVEYQSVRVSLLDCGNEWVGEAAPPVGLVAASKEALQYMKNKYHLVRLFTNGTTLYSPLLNELVLNLIQAVDAPMLSIAPKFARSATVGNISSVTFEIRNFQHGVQWIENNLAGMTGLKTLSVNAFLATSGTEQDQISLNFVSKDFEGNRQEYKHCLCTEDGFEFYGVSAMQVVGQFIVDQDHEQGILDLWMLMDRCLTNRVRFPSFPETVVMGFHWQ